MAPRPGTLTLRRADGRIVSESVTVMDSFGRRMKGLLGRRRLRQGEGVVLRPSWSVHTWFMRFPIDLLFIDRDGRVLRAAENVGPFRFVSGGRGARRTIELPAGTIANAKVAPGATLALDPA